MADNQPRQIHVIGNCEILGKLGQGAMGAVYKARQISLDRIVALKVLPPNIAKDATFIERFQREARACAKLNHPNIVQGINVGQDAATGFWFFVMEYVDGPTLRAKLEAEKIIPEKRALEIVREVTKALDCAASQGIVHRDIKPDNILLTSEGNVKLADLGLAKQVSDDSGMTVSGMAVGTPFYMAPEQARGEIKDLDFRTDEYALGATLFHLVTGETPFSAPSSASVMVKHLTEKAPLANTINRNVSERCARLIERMMQKEPAKRFQTPAELLVHIDKAIKGEVLSARDNIHATGRRTPVTMRAPKVATKSSNGLVLAGLGLVAAGILAWTLLGHSTPPQTHITASAVKPLEVPAHPAVLNTPGTKNEKEKTALPVPATAKTPEKEKPPSTPAAAVPEAAVAIRTTNAADSANITKPNPGVEKKGELAEAHAMSPEKPLQSAPEEVKKDSRKPERPAKELAELAERNTRSRFLSELIHHGGKNMEDLQKVLTFARDLALKPEYSASKDGIKEEIKDLEHAISFEEKAVNALGAAKGDVDLPADLLKLTNGEKTGKVLRSTNGHSLAISVSGVETTIPITKVALKKVIDAGPKEDVEGAALLAVIRNNLDEARTLTSSASENERKRLDDKMGLLKFAEEEATAENDYKELVTLFHAKEWKMFLAKHEIFEKIHGETAVAARTATELNAFKEAAAIAALPPVTKIFHAKSAELLADGFVKLTYDFSTPEQLLDFKCLHADLVENQGRMFVPPGGEEWSQARFIAPIAEMKHLEVTGRTLRGSARFGIYFIPKDADTPMDAPRCICRGYNRMPHLENWTGPFAGCQANEKCNVTGPVQVNWMQDLTYTINAKGRDYSWKVGGNDVGEVKLPASAVGGYLAFIGNNGGNAWRDVTITFQPDEAWVKAQAAASSSK